MLVIDDYGHHPTEIAAVIAAAAAPNAPAAGGGRRLVVVFQPHRYSRTRGSLACVRPGARRRGRDRADRHLRGGRGAAAGHHARDVRRAGPPRRQGAGSCDPESQRCTGRRRRRSRGPATPSSRWAPGRSARSDRGFWLRSAREGARERQGCDRSPLPARSRAARPSPPAMVSGRGPARAGRYGGDRGCALRWVPAVESHDRVLDVPRHAHRRSRQQPAVDWRGLRDRCQHARSQHPHGKAGTAARAAPRVAVGRKRIAAPGAAVHRGDHDRRTVADRPVAGSATGCIWWTPTGAIIDEYGPQYADLDLPIIDGLAYGPPRREPLIDEARAGLAARLLASVASRPELARRVSQIDVRDVHDAVVMLEDDSALIHVGEQQFARAAAGLLSKWRRRCASGCPTSTTWMFGSTSGCTCGRRSGGELEGSRHEKRPVAEDA